jgi:fucose permease
MVEFAFTLWSGVAIRDWHATTEATAALGPLFFVGGMALGRLISAAADRLASPGRLIAAAALLVVGGFAGFSSAPSVGLAFAWLVVAGLGVAPLYPQTLTQLIGASATPDAGSRWGAVASGTAITVSPQILGRVADGVGLRWAYVLVPVLVVLLVIQQLAQHRSALRHTAAGH